MLRNICCALVVAPFLFTAVGAAPIVTAGHHDLLPDTPGQVIPILVSGVPGAPPKYGGTGDGFAAVDLALTVNDRKSGPAIMDVDLVGAGTVFFGNNLGQTFMPGMPALPDLGTFVMTITAAGYIGPNGTLAFVTLDSRGVAPGNYPLDLHYDFGGGPNFTSLPPFPSAGKIPLPPATLIDGTLTVLQPGQAALVPEPSSLVLLASGVIGAFFFIGWRRNR